jgi:hypothetical protein
VRKYTLDRLAELVLSQFEKETVEAIIEFIYSGKIEFKGDWDIIKIAEAADFLLMPALFELCLGGIGEFSSEAVSMFAMLFKLGKMRLAYDCISVFAPDWSKSKSIDTLSQEEIQFIILSMRKSQDTELWNILLEWTEARSIDDPESRYLYCPYKIGSQPTKEASSDSLSILSP